jgi:hypothetical protein
MKFASGLLLIFLLTFSCVPTTPGPPQSSTATAIPTTQNSTETAIPTAAETGTPSPVETSTPPSAPHLESFGTVAIDAAEIEVNVNGDGSNVDSIAFWEADDPTQSLMIVTSKGNSSIEVYQYPFQTQLTTIACGDRSNGVWVDQERDVLYITKRSSSDVCAFRLPDLIRDESLSFTTAATGGKSEPNLTMLSLPGGGKRIYISYDEVVYYHDAESGAALGSFVPSKGLETMYGDDFYQVLYIPDEGGRTGVYMYDADGNPTGSPFGDRSIFDSDAEGIWVYKCLADSTDSGEGLILVSDQKEDVTDFEVFNRKTKEYLGKINIGEVNNTDGIAITQQSSSEYPLGLLAVIDDDESTVGVGWDTIFAKTGLACGT